MSTFHGPPRPTGSRSANLMKPPPLVKAETMHRRSEDQKIRRYDVKQVRDRAPCDTESHPPLHSTPPPQPRHTRLLTQTTHGHRWMVHRPQAHRLRVHLHALGANVDNERVSTHCTIPPPHHALVGVSSNATRPRRPASKGRAQCLRRCTHPSLPILLAREMQLPAPWSREMQLPAP